MRPEVLFNEVEKIVKPIFMVGGSVRDELLGREPTDYDFATPLGPDEIEARVRSAGKKPYLVGKKFGTVGARIGGQLVEITTFRTARFTGSRALQVEFTTNLKEDLSHRDFTINAIAKDANGYFDPFGGRSDLVAKVIQCVGKPKERFDEDPLRMLRVARFAAQLGFEVEATTEQRVNRMVYRILQTSRERWGLEMDKLLTSDQPGSGLEILARTRLLNFMFPELALQVGYDQNSPYHPHTLWEHTKKVVAGVPPEVELRWAALLHDIAKPFVRVDRPGRSNYLHHDLLGKEMVIRMAGYLKWSRARTQTVAELVLSHLIDSSPLKGPDSSAK